MLPDGTGPGPAAARIPPVSGGANGTWRRWLPACYKSPPLYEVRYPMMVKSRAVSLARSARYALPAALLLLTACAGDTSTEELPYVERPVEQIYTEAANAIDREQFVKAAALFEEVERQHPYSQWAVRAQLMTAYSMYQAQRYDDAITKLDGFISLHPGN
ncbi:MAG: hypothetical protein RLY86_4362, partial [Pseudomonadota bacterium]